VSKQNEIKHINIENVSEHSEYLKQLEGKNLKLRMENAYLKELRRLQTKRHSRIYRFS